MVTGGLEKEAKEENNPHSSENGVDQSDAVRLPSKSLVGPIQTIHCSEMDGCAIERFRLSNQ